MPTQTQYEYLERNFAIVKSPILIIGSKLYEYDKFDFAHLFNGNGIFDIVGIDVSSGRNVDVIADITDLNNPYFDERQSYFNTVICMSVLMYVNNPFDAGLNIAKITQSGAILFLSEPFTHKTTAMPLDHWRFTFNAFKSIFNQFNFNDSLSQCSFTRSNITFNDLRDESIELIYGKRHRDENKVAYFIRRISSKLFAKGFFKISRLMPEISIFAIAVKK